MKAFAATAFLVCAGCSSPAAPVAAPAPAPSEPVASNNDRGLGGTDRGWQGVIVARNAVNLAAKVDGTLQEVRVRVGDHVRANTVVALVDVGPVRHELALAEA